MKPGVRRMKLPGGSRDVVSVVIRHRSRRHMIGPVACTSDVLCVSRVWWVRHMSRCRVHIDVRQGWPTPSQFFQDLGDGSLSGRCFVLRGAWA